ncbi:MAG: hypothetical protein KDJ52_08060 [Anaerolineae bacterium]|nr:hypothetical protein [Anaerolineae bacterium]
MKKKNLLVRVGLFFAILILGTMVAMAVGETTGLALADLSSTTVDTIINDAANHTLFATLDEKGIYRSNDAGYSWQMISSGPSDAIVKTLAIHPLDQMTLYASTVDQSGHGSLWLSKDGGEHWTALPLDLPTSDQETSPVINTIAIDSNAPEMLYLGTEGQGLYRFDLTTNQAEQIGSNPRMQELYVRDFDISSSGDIYAVTTEGLMVVDGTSMHSLEHVPDTPVSIAIDPVNPQRLYVGTVAYGVFTSHDGGQSWQALNAGFGWQPGVMLRVSAVTVDEDKPQHLAVATAYSVGSQLIGDGIYESFNAGQHWIKIAEHEDVVDQLVIQGGGIYAATTQGLVRYGNPLPGASLTSSLHFNSLANPTAVQILILAITAAIAGWVLLGKVSGRSYQNQTAI